ncbi:MAG TPA: neutral/alkaline non-lysosomal ceramidase N-terminal domain-containing protein, partial [Nevskiaceae bacterium]|nr:neutral/alkaline non-lysosomal ceramidase N-terminal domain-containing protein [Nevskiaceae bacterium]
GVSCASGLDALERASLDLQTLLEVDPTGAVVGGFPPHVLPLQLISGAAMCNLALLPPLPGGVDFTCHAEKPVALPVGGPFGGEPTILPFQVARIGNLGLIAVPWEVTTMSARRIRKQMLEVLAPAGIDTVVVIGLANDYVHYLPTREEYSAQQYEGASSLFGPWSLAAVQQELRRLAITLRDGTPAPEGPAYVDGVNVLTRPPYMASDVGTFGAVVTDAPETAAPGDVVTASFEAGHPRNDLRIGASYVYAERLLRDGSWEVVADDNDPRLLFLWNAALPSPLPIDPPLIGPSTATVQWTIPKNVRAGTYRLRHEGAARTSPTVDAVPYTGVSRLFTVSGATSACPD